MWKEEDLEDAAKLIRRTVDNFTIDPDKAAISRIHESLSTLQQARDLRIREAENALRKLSRSLTHLTTQHTETLSTHSPTAHTSRILELDTQKFRVAKTASELEIESERLEQELEGLKHRLADLEAQGVEGDEAERARRESEDPIVLKLKIYRSLGIDVSPDSAGQYNKAIIRNNQKGDVHVVNIDPKFSRYFYANFLWQTL